MVGSLNEAQEIEVFRQPIAIKALRFRALVPRSECSEYFEGRCGLLVHIVVTRDMAEARNAAAVDCAMLDGQPLGDAQPAALKNLPDYCPIFADIEDRDRD